MKIKTILYLLIIPLLFAFSVEPTHAFFDKTFSFGLEEKANKIEAIDIDNDGDDDLTLLNTGANTITLFENKNGDQFNKIKSIEVIQNPRDLEIADMDKDQDLDIVVASYGGAISVLENENGEISKPNNYARGMRTESISVSDLDQDGDQDVVGIDRTEDEVSIYLNNGEGVLNKFLTKERQVSEPFSVVTGDLNSDSYPELIIVDKRRGVLVIKNQSEGQRFGSSKQYNTNGEAVQAQLVDINKNQKKDIVVSTRGDRGVEVFENKGEFEFSKRTSALKTSTNPNDFIASNINQDQLKDLFFAERLNSSLDIFINQDSFDFNNQKYQLDREAIFLTSGDFNSDANKDLAVLNEEDSKQITVIPHKQSEINLNLSITDRETKKTIATSSDSYQSEGFFSPSTFNVNSSTNEIKLKLNTSNRDVSKLNFSYSIASSSEQNFDFSKKSILKTLEKSKFNSDSSKNINLPRGQFTEDFYLKVVIFARDGNGTSDLDMFSTSTEEVDDIIPVSLKIVKQDQMPEDKKEESEADDSQIQCPVETNSFYSHLETKSVWKVTDRCTKRPIQSSEVYFTHADSWDNIKTVDKIKINQIKDDIAGFLPWGKKWEPKSGTLVKTPEDSKVYLLLDNKRHWIKTAKVFSGLNYNWSWIQDVDSDFINKYPSSSEINYTDRHPPESLVRYKDTKTVYKLEQGKNRIIKRRVKSMETIKNMNYRKDRIVTIPTTEKYPTGPSLTN